jgi:RimJ/RimL family protein N-acetyltransferase
MANGIPITRNLVSPERVERIRDAVWAADTMGASRIADFNDTGKLLTFLSDPAVHAPIYSLPRPLDWESVMHFIVQHRDEKTRGEGLLLVRENEAGEIVGYSDIQIWPQWGAGELGGAIHPSLQGKGRGTAGAAQSFDWMFETLGLELICETASLENIATQKMLDALGFRRMGEIVSARSDGSTRPSLVWEITRKEWRARRQGS